MNVYTKHNIDISDLQFAKPLENWLGRNNATIVFDTHKHTYIHVRTQTYTYINSYLIAL